MEGAKKHSFKVYIPITPKWKIEAIARYKAIQQRKRKPPVEEKHDVKIISITEAAKKQRMDEILKGGHEITQEINTLNSVRRSLIWLLKKSTLYETNLNHA